MAKPTKADAEAAIRVLIEWAGDDPHREGLIDTPARVARSYRELFAGYTANPRDYLKRTFEEVGATTSSWCFGIFAWSAFASITCCR